MKYIFTLTHPENSKTYQFTRYSLEEANQLGEELRGLRQVLGFKMHTNVVHGDSPDEMPQWLRDLSSASPDQS